MSGGSKYRPISAKPNLNIEAHVAIPKYTVRCRVVVY